MAIENFAVEASHIMMFARSIGDGNQVYYDEKYGEGSEAGSIIAPPTFAQASAQFDEKYFLRPKIGKPWFGSGKEGTGLKKEKKEKKEGESSGAAAGGLHAEQHFEYHRHIKPGDVLSATVKQGEGWEKQSKRAGTLRFTETITEYRDQDGELVITARGVAVTTEKIIEN